MKKVPRNNKLKSIPRLSFLLIAVWSLAIAFGGGAESQKPQKFAKDLQSKIKKAGPATERVIVQLMDRPSVDDLVEVYRLRGHLRHVYDHLPAYAAEVPADKLEALAENPNVKWVSPDRPVTKSEAYAIPATKANLAWQSYSVTGGGVGLAIVDSGIHPHSDVASRIIGWKDIVNPANATPVDENGHGTHVAGIAGGNSASANSGGYSASFYGVAPGANLIGVRVLNASGVGYVSDVVAGIDWCIANKSAYNIRVMNVSLGHPVYERYTTDPLCLAVERAYQAGIVVVVAAGNRGRSVPTNPDGPAAFGNIDSPGNDPFVITVGATNTRGTMDTGDDVMCTYSSHGPSRGDLVLKPDLVAPGNRTVSLRRPGGYLDTAYPWGAVTASSFGGSGDSQYFTLSGTSMSTPMVAGAAALLVQQNPALSPDTVKVRLMASANKNVRNRDGSLANVYLRGAGQLDVTAALGMSGYIASGKNARSPKMSRGALLGLFKLTTLSGSNILWGEDPEWTNTIMWGQNILWGELPGETTLWGENVLWSDDLLWNNNILWGEDPTMGENGNLQDP